MRPLGCFAAVKLAAEPNADHPALGRQLPQPPVRHVARDIVNCAQAVMRGDYRIAAEIDRLRDRLIESMRNVDYDPKPVHFADPCAPTLV